MILCQIEMNSLECFYLIGGAYFHMKNYPFDIRPCYYFCYERKNCYLTKLKVSKNDQNGRWVVLALKCLGPIV
jgi:hypothetical protein